MNNNIRMTILIGDVIEAHYKKQELDEYSNNPLIEALPDIVGDDEIINRFTVSPEITDNDRNKSETLRYHIIKRTKNFIQPLPEHLLLGRRLGILIRRGYLCRNPLSKEFLKRIRVINQLNDNSIKNKDMEDYLSDIRTTADSISVVGISGIGKTTAIERLLLMYPQVIRHSKYKNQNLTRTQIVWLKIDCPYDGSLSTLCKSFFKAIDDILGTRYLEKFGYSNRVASNMLINMSKLAWIYGIGVLVIDEIQNLLNSRNNEQEMLNFFVTLTNTVGIPTVLIGTSKAQKIFDANFRQARRAASEGSIIWDRMKKESDEWNYFIESMWRIQGLNKIAKLTDEIKNALYDECQGITAIAVNLFILSQERALQEEEEELTVRVIRETAKEDLHMIQPMIKALKNNNLSEIMKYEDISINFEEISNLYQRNIEFKGILREIYKEKSNSVELKRKSRIENLILELTEIMDIFNNLKLIDIRKICEKIVETSDTNEDYTNHKKEALKKAIELNERLESQKSNKTSEKLGSGLMKIYNFAIDRKVHPYELLKNNGYIKNPIDEFFKLG